jgi:FMN phosphatase YigB (HAD superfamily)
VAKFNHFEVFFDDLYDQFASPKTWQLFEETHSVLEYFKKKGYVVGMISNWDRRLLHLCEAFDIKKYFCGSLYFDKSILCSKKTGFNTGQNGRLTTFALVLPIK